MESRDAREEMHVGIKAFLRNRDGRYLMLRRSNNDHHGAGKWDLPGGRMEYGQSVLDNLKREIREETGLEMIREPVIFDVHDVLWPDGHQVVRVLFTGEIEGEPRLSHEHSEYRWFLPDEISALEEAEFDARMRALVAAKLSLLQ